MIDVWPRGISGVSSHFKTLWKPSLFLLQQIFLTQESNGVLLNCRRILYQLSYLESPRVNADDYNSRSSSEIFTRGPIFCQSALEVLVAGKWEEESVHSFLHIKKTTWQHFNGLEEDQLNGYYIKPSKRVEGAEWRWGWTEKNRIEELYRR